MSKDNNETIMTVEVAEVLLQSKARMLFDNPLAAFTDLPTFEEDEEDARHQLHRSCFSFERLVFLTPECEQRLRKLSLSSLDSHGRAIRKKKEGSAYSPCSGAPVETMNPEQTPSRAAKNERRYTQHGRAAK